MRSMVQKMKKTLVFALAVLMLSGSAMADFGATVLSKNMKVYFAPSTSSEYLGSLKSGTKVSIKAHQGGWAKISYKGRVGFAKVADMYSNSVWKKGKTTETAKIYYITRKDTKPRWGTLGKDTNVYIRGAKGDKWLVSNKSFSVLGYIEKDSVSFID